jgi:hypothetical protein
MLTACSTDSAPTAPTATTPLAATAAARARLEGERVPGVEVRLHGTELRVFVARAPLCSMQVLGAGYGMRGRVLDIVTRVSPHPAALCTSESFREWVSVSRLDVPRPTAGRWQVRVFEALGDQPPAFLGEHEITVVIPDTLTGAAEDRRTRAGAGSGGGPVRP